MNQISINHQPSPDSSPHRKIGGILETLRRPPDRFAKKSGIHISFKNRRDIPQNFPKWPEKIRLRPALLGSRSDITIPRGSPIKISRTKRSHRKSIRPTVGRCRP